MSHLNYLKEEIERFFSSWFNIMEEWDDNKSKAIDSEYFQLIVETSKKLIDFSEESSQSAQALLDESERE